MRIRLNTTFVSYSKTGLIKPKHPLWVIKNDGGVNLIINNDFQLLTGGGTLGVDAMKILIPVIQHYIDTGGKEKIEIVNDTQFSVDVSKGYDEIINVDYTAIKYTLIETSIEIEP